jgi:predicted N-acetyltransferase YhbS
MEVREVTSVELWPEYKMLLKAAPGFGYKIPLPNSNKAMDTLAFAMVKGLNFVAIDKEEIIGAVILIEETLWWVDEVFLVDIAFYVAEGKRTYKAASMLTDKAIQRARELGLPLQFSVTYGTDLDRKEKFILRKGFKKIGGNYLMMETING